MALFAYIMLPLVALMFLTNHAWAQPATPEEFVTYEKQSGFIKEFEVPFDDVGLKGITNDADGNVWFYHSTNMTSTLVMFEPVRGEFTKFPVEGETVADEPIINLASSQLAYDSIRNAVWFTDSRINSIGQMDVETGEIRIWSVPTEEAGPMGIVLSPDGNSVWFAEITGDKIGRLDASTGEIEEYPTGQESGPALLAFDDTGQLWVTLSFADSVLVAQTWALAPNSSLGMTRLLLPQPDRFSPLGIAFSGGKVFLPDHGSSRIIVADVNSDLQQYDIYWTSPAPAFPTTLPSQAMADRQGNVYVAQHGGNRISVISPDGVMTEYEVPTGPLSTVVYLSVADNDERVWFAEWASNKIAYLDTAIQVPFTLDTQKAELTLTENDREVIPVSLSLANREAGPVSLSEVEIGLTGVTESGLRGVTYEAQPPRVNLQESESAQSEIIVRTTDSARSGSYTVMVKASAPENDNLVVSKLYPVEMVLDMPERATNQGTGFQNQPRADSTSFQDAVRIGAPVAAAGLIAFAVYRWKRAKRAR